MKKLIFLAIVMTIQAQASEPQLLMSKCSGILNDAPVKVDVYINHAFYCGELSSFEASVVVQEATQSYLQKGELTIEEGVMSLNAQDGDFNLAFKDFAYPAFSTAFMSIRTSPEEMTEVTLECENSEYEVSCYSEEL